MRRSKREVSWWKVELRSTLAELEKLYNELQRYQSWQTRGKFFYHGGGLFLCGRQFNRHDKAKMIRMQRKFQQLKSTKIPYFLERIAERWAQEHGK